MPRALKAPTSFEDAIALHRAGRTEEAEDAYRQVLLLAPNDHRALYALSVLTLASGQNDATERLLSRAVELAPDQTAYHMNLGEVRRRLGRYRDARIAILRALAIQPDLAEGFYNLGILLWEEGDFERALLSFVRAVDLKPDVVSFQLSLARALRDQGELVTAVLHYRCAVLLAPQLRSARDELTAILALVDESDPELRASRVPARAIAHLHCALAVDPRSIGTLVALGQFLRDLHRIDGAVAMGRRAVAIAPRSAQAQASLGAALTEQGRTEEAIQSCRLAVAIDPESAEARFRLGNGVLALGHVEEAIECFRRVLALSPTHHVAHSNLVLTMSYDAAYDQASLYREARAWSRAHEAPLANRRRPHDNDRSVERPLRIGYVSADFYTHPCSHFIAPLLEHHDRQSFEIFCYSNVIAPDAMTERLKADSDVWKDLRGVGDIAAADIVRHDRIDILVDLSLHTGRNRLRLFACKPAPVQISWLGYPGTTGLESLDYRMTDPFLELDEAAYSEAPLVLPASYWCYDPLGATPEVGPLPLATCGQVTFGCMNSFHKINRETVALWARVLLAHGGSRLVMHAPPGSWEAVLALFEGAGIDRSRVSLLPRRPRGDYLRTFHRIDIALDTSPFNGATTTLDALWMGVPVVTLLGRTRVGRSGLSIMSNLGATELVAANADDYVRIASNLGRDAGRLGELRAGLRDRLKASPLMDAPRFACDIESAYRSAWQRWSA